VFYSATKLKNTTEAITGRYGKNLVAHIDRTGDANNKVSQINAESQTPSNNAVFISGCISGWG
jgi:hypothetical protein